MDSFRRQRLDYDLAEAELARAEAALALGEPSVARRWAAAAARRFRRQDNEACACLAELTRLRALSIRASRRAPIAAEALLLAKRLRDCGLTRDADIAELLAARALLADGRTDEARQLIAAGRRRGQVVPLTASLLRRLVRAELAEQEGQRGAALAELRAGLTMVQAQRGRLGSVDLQTGIAALGADLAAAGCGWRWTANPHRWCSPGWNAPGPRRSGPGQCDRPRDPQVAAALAELRQLGRLLRERRADRQARPADRGQVRRPAARAQGARLAGRRPRPGRRSGQPRRSDGGPGRERAEPSRHPGAARPDARGSGRSRIGAPDQNWATSRRLPRRPGG